MLIKKTNEASGEELAQGTKPFFFKFGLGKADYTSQLEEEISCRGKETLYLVYRESLYTCNLYLVLPGWDV